MGWVLLLLLLLVMVVVSGRGFIMSRYMHMPCGVFFFFIVKNQECIHRACFLCFNTQLDEKKKRKKNHIAPFYLFFNCRSLQPPSPPQCLVVEELFLLLPLFLSFSFTNTHTADTRL